jgi:hypothetical protein
VDRGLRAAHQHGRRRRSREEPGQFGLMSFNPNGAVTFLIYVGVTNTFGANGFTAANLKGVSANFTVLYPSFALP